MEDGKVCLITGASSSIDRYAGRGHRCDECSCNRPTAGG
mgnify:CR=1 FL=1